MTEHNSALTTFEMRGPTLHDNMASPRVVRSNRCAAPDRLQVREIVSIIRKMPVATVVTDEWPVLGTDEVRWRCLQARAQRGRWARGPFSVTLLI